MKKYFTAQIVITAIVLFFISRSWLPGGLMPFGFAAFAAVFSKIDFRINIFYAVVVSLGVLSTGSSWQLLMIVVSIAFIFIMKHILPATEKTIMRQAALVFSCSLFSSILIIAIKNFLLYDFLKTIVQALICFVVFCVMRSVSEMLNDKASRKIMTNEEMACIAIVASIAIMGLPDLLLYGLSLRRLLSVLIIIVFSYRGGLGTGATCGVAVGVLMASSTTTGAVTAAIISLYAFCGFLSGLFNKVGRIGVSLGFFLGNFLLTILLIPTADLIINVYEIGFAVLIFFILPEKLTAFLKLPQLTGIKIPTVRVNYAEKLKETAVNKLQSFSDIFKEMSWVCNDLSERDILKGREEVLQVMDRIAARVCKDCGLCTQCWEQSFYETYGAIMELISAFESKGKISIEEVPQYLVKNCSRVNILLTETRNIFEMWKLENLWRKRLWENKQILPTQLIGMSGILSNLAEEVNTSVCFMESLEKNIVKEMNKNDMRVRNATVCRNKFGRYEATLEVKCCGGRRECVSRYGKVVSDALGVKMSLDNDPCLNPSHNLWCSITYSEEEIFHTATGVVGVPAWGSTQTGDSHSFMPIGKGFHMAALSDGMGTGERAARQSKCVIRLLELFMESGLEKVTAVNMINSLLTTGTEKELSATIDMALFDLYSGKAIFLKLGATPSIIKRNDRVETVVISSPPVGLMRNISEFTPVERKLENGDFVILMSDGIGEAYRRANMQDTDLYSFIENLSTKNPQEFAEKIMKRAMDLSDDKPQDDMMVLVTKVWKKYL